MKAYGLIGTDTQSDSLPNYIETTNTYQPTWEQCRAAGWRKLVSEDAAPAGCTITAQLVQDIDGETAKLIVVSYDDPVADATAQEAAKRASFTPLIPVATAYRNTLRLYFGTNAETNQNITKDFVFGYFLQVQQGAVAGLPNRDAGLDAAALQSGFQVLSQWNGTNETWSLPWDMVP